MKKPLLLSLIVLSMVFATTTVKAQFNPYTENTKLLTAGFGVSGYGVHELTFLLPTISR